MAGLLFPLLEAGSWARGGLLEGESALDAEWKWKMEILLG